ncbi:MAG TPA: GrpB family protein [Solirubrobacterales bacterium]|nr:GrpB family protein [Solirubrobacterales bacterium]
MDGESIPLIREEEIRGRVAAIFGRRRAELDGMLPGARIEHVGSTAVPGSLTKGDLDICVIVAGEEFERRAASSPSASRSTSRRTGRRPSPASPRRARTASTSASSSSPRAAPTSATSSAGATASAPTPSSAPATTS